jgi:hypothetical protein
MMIVVILKCGLPARGELMEQRVMRIRHVACGMRRQKMRREDKVYEYIRTLRVGKKKKDPPARQAKISDDY